MKRDILKGIKSGFIEPINYDITMRGKTMKRKILSMIASAGLMAFLMATTTVLASGAVTITEIQGRANSWKANPNWVGFKLSDELDLGEAGTDVVLTYEYVEDGELKQLRRETGAPGTLYMKNKLWDGYLNELGGTTRYSQGAAGVNTYVDLLPADTTLSSNLSDMSASTAYPKLTQKVQNGEVEYFRVRVTIYEDGKVADDKTTNWIKYSSDLSDASPKGISAIVPEDNNAHSDEPAVQGIAPLATTEQITVDGVDYISLEAAIYAAQPGDTIEIPAGVHEIYSQIVIDKELTIVGAGIDNTILKYIDTYGSPAAISSAYAGKNPIIYATDKLTMSNLTIGGPITTHRGIDGIYTTADLHLTGVKISDIRSEMDGAEYTGDQFGRAVVADGSAVVTITDSVFDKFQKTAIDTKDIAALTVTGNTITGAGPQGIIAQNGIIMRGSTDAEVKDNKISGLQYTGDNDSVAIYLLDDATKVLADKNEISDIDIAFYGAEDSELTIGENGNTITNATTDFEGLTPNYPATAMSVSDKTLALKVMDTVVLATTFVPANATNQAVTWTSSDPAVATVQNGEVKAIAPGTAVITVVAADGAFTDTCEVTVTAPVVSVKLSQTGLALKVNSNATLTATILPANASNKAISWISFSPAVATVQNGVVKAIAPGTAIIAVRTADGTFTDICEVIVTAPVTGVKLNKKTLSLGVNTGETLTAEILPANASNKTSIWTSSNPAVATVQNGVVKAIATGKAVITVKTADGAFTDTCEVTVTIPVASLKISKKTLNLALNKSATLKATVLPANATDKKVIWTSSAPKVVTVKNGVIKAIAPGKAVIKVTAADGKLIDSCTVKVAFSKTTGFKVKRVKKTAKVTWKQVKNATGYQITIEKVNKSSVEITTRRVVPRNKAKSLSYTTGTLKKGTYRYKIRAYRDINGTRHYGAYTKYKTIKIK